MRDKIWDKTVKTAAVIAVGLIVAGCASSQSTQLTPRFLGYSEALYQGEKLLFSGDSLVEQERVAAAAALQANRGVSFTMVTKVILPQGGQAIIRRQLPLSGYEESFGRETEMVFSIQLCNQLGNENGGVVCRDASAQPPTTISKRILMSGGQKVTVQFPHDIQWTYKVLDQVSPMIAN